MLSQDVAEDERASSSIAAVRAVARSLALYSCTGSNLEVAQAVLIRTLTAKIAISIRRHWYFNLVTEAF
jgi:hypothetical protein